MIGADDLFSRAMIENQLKHIDKQFDLLFEVGIPEDMRQYWHVGLQSYCLIITAMWWKFARAGAAAMKVAKAAGIHKVPAPGLIPCL